MFLFLILALILLVLVLFIVFAVTIGGSIFIIIFSDVIVCAFIIGWIIKKLIDRRK